MTASTRRHRDGSLTRRRTLWPLIAAATMAVSGCAWFGETQINGRVAVSVSDRGSPVVVLAVCTGNFTRVDVSSARSDLPGAHLSTEVAQRQSFDLDVSDPSTEWSGSRLDRVEPGVLYAVLGSGGGDLVGGKAAYAATGTDFTAEELAALTPTTVQTVVYSGADGETRRVVVETRKSFLQGACRGSS